MQIDILTLFPRMFDAFLHESILKRAVDAGYLQIAVHDIRDAATDKHHTVDDTPYGGGTGMLMRVDVVDAALQKVVHAGRELVQLDPLDKLDQFRKPHIILLTPQGTRLTAQKAESFAKHEWLILICGHYEGFDERIREHLVDEQISIGDYVLTGGELPALVLVDAVSRFVPGVLPKGAAQEDSFSLSKDGRSALEYPHYTKPQEYKGWSVPDVLLSGNHAEIEKWRKEQSRPA